MLYDPIRHEPLTSIPWDEDEARACIQRIVDDAETRFSADSWWPIHPLDADHGDKDPLYPLYFGAAGVIWALHHLQDAGTCKLRRNYAECIQPLLLLNQAWLAKSGSTDFGSYLMGDTGILLLEDRFNPTDATSQRLEALIAGNIDNPTRELLWGAPGTM